MERMPSPWTCRALLATCISLLGPLNCAAAVEAPPAPTQQGSLERVTIVGTRVSTTMGQETEGLTILGREQIERLGVAGSADLLRQVAGVQVDQVGGPGGLSLAYIRGSDPNHVLVLVDGVRMNDPTNSRGGAFDLSNIDPAEVERIEVLRGAASAIYGADAMGGVINIVTRKGEPGVSATFGLGGLGYGASSARTTLRAGGGNWLSASASTLRDGQDQAGGSLKLDRVAIAGRALVAEGSRIDAQLRHAERTSNGFPDDSGGIDLAVIRTLEHRRSATTALGTRGVLEAGAWTLSLEGTILSHQENIQSPGVAPGVRSSFGIPASSSESRYRRSSALFSASRRIGDGSVVAVGVESVGERGATDTVYELFGMQVPAEFDLRRSTRSVFTDLKWLASPELVIRAGLRHDAVGGNGSHTSPTLGMRYGFASLDGDFIASYSEGFKPPSFFALGLPPALGGNPALKAEGSKGLSLGYEQRLPGGMGEASMAIFERKYSNLVTFANETNQLVNAVHVNVSGVEFAVEARLAASFALRAHYTRLSSEVFPGNEPLRQRPGKRAGIQLTWQFTGRAQLVCRLEYADQIYDSSVPTGSLFLPRYLRNDWVLAYSPSSGVMLLAAIDNLADRANEWYVGARSQGRRARVAASLAF